MGWSLKIKKGYEMRWNSINSTWRILVSRNAQRSPPNARIALKPFLYVFSLHDSYLLYRIHISLMERNGNWAHRTTLFASRRNTTRLISQSNIFYKKLHFFRLTGLGKLKKQEKFDLLDTVANVKPWVLIFLFFLMSYNYNWCLFCVVVRPQVNKLSKFAWRRSLMVVVLHDIAIFCCQVGCPPLHRLSEFACTWWFGFAKNFHYNRFILENNIGNQSHQPLMRKPCMTKPHRLIALTSPHAINPNQQALWVWKSVTFFTSCRPSKKRAAADDSENVAPSKKSKQVASEEESSKDALRVSW